MRPIDRHSLPWDAVLSNGETAMDSAWDAPPLMLIALLILSGVLLVLVFITMRR